MMQKLIIIFCSLLLVVFCLVFARLALPPRYVEIGATGEGAIMSDHHGGYVISLENDFRINRLTGLEETEHIDRFTPQNSYGWRPIADKNFRYSLWKRLWL